MDTFIESSKRYRLFFDETGIGHLRDAKQPYLSLTALAIRQDLHDANTTAQLNALKKTVFKTENIVLHRREIIGAKGTFSVLKDAAVRKQFDDGFAQIVDNLSRPAFTVSIDKKAHLEKYKVWQYSPYHYALICLLERFVLWLHYSGNVGDVMGEPPRSTRVSTTFLCAQPPWRPGCWPSNRPMKVSSASTIPPAPPMGANVPSRIASRMRCARIEGGALTNKRPFRAPHHSASMPALVGGGLRARPGEISLAHNGVLFLDEMPEFSGQVLDSLRQPLETGEVAIARVNHRITYPARFMLVAAMNPCRCGRASDPGFACKRGSNARCAAEYQGRLSGPLLDRIDLHIEVPAVTAADLILPPPSEGSREVAARVARARDIQTERYAAKGLLNMRTNAQANGPVLEDVARADKSGMALLRDAADSMHLSARGYHRVLRVARTLADLDGAEKVGRVHLAEALSYRALIDEVRRAA